MKENKKGYYVYSIFTVLFFVGLFGFAGYLVYDLILKLSVQDFTNNTVIQAFITLVITVFIGGYFTKRLEHNNSKRIELYKIKNDIALRMVDLSSAYFYNYENEDLRRLVIAESSKIKLYFDDETLKSVNEFLTNQMDKDILYQKLVDNLKENIK